PDSARVQRGDDDSGRGAHSERASAARPVPLPLLQRYRPGALALDDAVELAPPGQSNHPPEGRTKIKSGRSVSRGQSPKGSPRQSPELEDPKAKAPRA